MAVQQKPARLTQYGLRSRGASAATKLREVLAPPFAMDDIVVLGIALAEIAAEEAKHNSAFRTAIQSRYAEIKKLRAGGTIRTGNKPKGSLPELVPVGNVPGFRSDPFSPPNPDNLVRVFGRPQLARALHDYTVEALKETAAQYEARHPGTKPTNRGRRDSLIAYIVQQYGNEHSR